MKGHEDLNGRVDPLLVQVGLRLQYDLLFEYASKGFKNTIIIMMFVVNIYSEKV
jgi:hypothetical protein